MLGQAIESQTVSEEELKSEIRELNKKLSEQEKYKKFALTLGVIGLFLKILKG